MKLYRFTFLFIVSTLAVFAGLMLVSHARASDNNSTRYVSKWTAILPGETKLFKLNMGRPMEVMVWVKIAEKSNPDSPMTVTIPSYDLETRAIRIVSVSDGKVSVRNFGAESAEIQVVANR